MSAKRRGVDKVQKTSNDDNKDQKVFINSLDYDSLAEIFMLLPIPDRIAMEKVCVKWKEACQRAWYDIKKYKCKSSIGRSYDNRLLTQSYLEEILLRCGKYLKELSLSNVCNSKFMPFVDDHCKNLTSLECQFNVISLSNNGDHFAQAFTQLNKLKILKITMTDNYYNETVNLSEIINSLPEKINEIHLLSKPRLISKRKVCMTLKKFKNLQKLTVHGLFSGNIHHEIAEKTTLVYLNIQLYDIPVWFCLFNKLVNLEYINLAVTITGRVHSNYISTKVLNTIFCTCKNLKHLDIVRCPYDVAEIPLKEWINLQNLQYLCFTCDIMPDLANTIVKYCKNLKHLKILNRNYIMDDTALKKLTELKNLECLSLLGCIRVKEESIVAISNNCKKLKCLEIHYGSIYDPRPFSSVLDEVSKLQYLEHLKLCMGEHLQDSTIIAIADNCKNLKSLEIRGCSAITETALGDLTKLNNLQKLDVSFLDITDSFIRKLKGIKELHCEGCTKLTDDGIIQLIKNNPDLGVIDVSLIDNITISLVIAADQTIKNRTNRIHLNIKISKPSIRLAFKSIIKSHWLVVR